MNALRIHPTPAPMPDGITVHTIADLPEMQRFLSAALRAKGGMESVRATGVSESQLYRISLHGHDPLFSTLIRLLDGWGYDLVIKKKH